MSSLIRLLPPKRDVQHVKPYSSIVTRVLYSRLVYAYNVASVLSMVSLFLTVFPIIEYSRSTPNGPESVISLIFKYSKLIASTTFLTMFVCKTIMVPEKRVYSTPLLEVFRKIASPRLILGFVCLSISSLHYFSFISPSISPESDKVVQFEAINYKGVPEDWKLHDSFDALIINETYLYTFSFSWALSFVLVSYVILKDLVIIRVRPVNDSKSVQRAKQSLISIFTNSAIVLLIISLTFPFFHALVIRRNFTFFSFYLLQSIPKYATKNLEGLEQLKCLFVVPIAYCPLLIFCFVSIECFEAYLTAKPTSNGKVLSEKCPEKDECLVTGLNSKPDTVTALIAWNELMVISEHQSERRKGIFNSVEGEENVWQKIDQSVQSIIKNQIEAFKPKPENTKKHNNDEKDKSAGNHNNKSTPHVRPISDTHIFSSTKHEPLLNPNSALEKKLARLELTLVSDSTARAENARNKLRNAYKRAVKYQKHLYMYLLATKPGFVLRTTPRRTLEMKIRHCQTTSLAIRSVARMITSSLKEDEYGYVQETVAAFLSKLDELAEILEKNIAHPPLDKMNMYVVSNQHDVSPAHTLLKQVNAAFLEVTLSFEKYFDNLNVSEKVRKRAQRTDLEFADSVYV